MTLNDQMPRTFHVLLYAERRFFDTLPYSGHVPFAVDS